jgi:glucokinase
MWFNRAMHPLYLGIEIGGTKLQLVLGDGSGKITRRWRHHVDRARGGVGIREQIAATIPEARAASSGAFLGVGVGFGGPVNYATGEICCSHQIEGWSEFPIGRWLSGLTHAPVRVDNDANVATLGEALHGAGRGLNPVFYVTLGSGVGGGLVVNERIFHGAVPGEAEIGHVRLDRSGTIVEERCSGWAVDLKIRAASASEPGGLLARLIGPTAGGEARHLGTALEQDDPTARRILDETAEDLAFGLSHVTHLIHPAVFVLGGGLSLLGEPLRAAVAKSLPGFVMHAFAPGPRITLAQLGEDVVPVGALALAHGA